MGEAALRRSATAKLLEKYPRCCFCGGLAPAETREHYPPISLFDNSLRPNQLIVPACRKCNGVSRTADLVTALIARWKFSFETSQTEAADYKKLANRLKYQAPDIVAEWLKHSTGVQQKRARRHLEASGVWVDPQGKIATIGPLTIPQLHLFAHKLLLAVFFDHMKHPVPPKGMISALFKTKEDVAVEGIPAEVKDHLGPNLYLSQGQGFSTRDQFEYRIASGENGKVFQVLARIRFGLIVAGFVVTEPDLLDPDARAGWITPPSLPSILADPEFRRKYPGFGRNK